MEQRLLLLPSLQLLLSLLTGLASCCVGSVC